MLILLCGYPSPCLPYSLSPLQVAFTPSSKNPIIKGCCLPSPTPKYEATFPFGVRGKQLGGVGNTPTPLPPKATWREGRRVRGKLPPSLTKNPKGRGEGKCRIWRQKIESFFFFFTLLFLKEF